MKLIDDCSHGHAGDSLPARLSLVHVACGLVIDWLLTAGLWCGSPEYNVRIGRMTSRVV